MTVCPIAIAVGCPKCPVFRICPVKNVLGDASKIDVIGSINSRPLKRAAKKPRNSKAPAKTQSK